MHDEQDTMAGQQNNDMHGGENSAGSRPPRTAIIYLVNMITRLPRKPLLSTEGVTVLVRWIPGFAFVPHHIVGADQRQLPSYDRR